MQRDQPRHSLESDPFSVTRNTMFDAIFRLLYLYISPQLAIATMDELTPLAEVEPERRDTL